MIQTDNSAEFQSAFHRHVLDKGIAHSYIKPSTPRLNGKVERSHHIDEMVWLRSPSVVVRTFQPLVRFDLPVYDNETAL